MMRPVVLSGVVVISCSLILIDAPTLSLSRTASSTVSRDNAVGFNTAPRYFARKGLPANFLSALYSTGAERVEEYLRRNCRPAYADGTIGRDVFRMAVSHKKPSCSLRSNVPQWKHGLVQLR